MVVARWWFKCAAQRVLSHVPMGRRINSLWSRQYLLNVLDSHVVGAGLEAIHQLRRYGWDLQGKTALEIGTGWKPVIPYLLRIAGCRQVVLCDANRLMTPEFLQATARQVRAAASRIAGALDSEASSAERIVPPVTGQDMATLLRQSGFEYRAPYDLRQTDYPDESIDIVSSNTTLEHISEDGLAAILKEMRRILKADGVMVHLIDHTDHWHYFDPSISEINYLKFSPWSWRVINSPMAYQNRLRSSQYVRLIREAGFRISHAERIIAPEALAVARSVKVDAEFERCAPEDLVTLKTYIVAQPQQAQSTGSLKQSVSRG
jgi:SAM-dependent methyltransferase